MLKIGILTFHSTINFGATLQAYALYKFLVDQGCDVEFINYRPKQLQKSDFQYLYLQGRFLVNTHAFQGFFKSQKTKQFIQSRMKMSKTAFLDKNHLKQSSDAYDIVICGSDEIWNVNSKYIGYDKSYFFDFIDDETEKIGYAASFGSTTDLAEKKESIAELLNKFRFVSVRDDNSVSLASSCNVGVEKVLDPTFLIDFRDITIKPKEYRNYVLVYGSLTRKEGKIVEDFAELHRLPIVSVGSKPGKWKPQNSLVGISPEEWLGFFAGASYVFTSFYHGVIFSILFRKPFVSFERIEKTIKVRDLLKDLNLAGQIIAVGREDNLQGQSRKLKDSDFEIDWPEKKLAILVARSRDFLKKAIEKEIRKSKS